MRHDTHNHTKYSIDSMMDIHDAIARADEYDLIMTFTEHFDPNEFNPDGQFTTFDQEGFFAEYTPLREAGKVLLGVELGLDINPAYIKQNIDLIDKYPFDQVIGSAHNMNGKDISYLPNKMEYSKEEFYPIYFKYVVDLLNANPYIDTFAHIDYPSRYTRYDYNPVHFEDYPELFNAIFMTLIKQNIALELNQKKLANEGYYRALNSIAQGYAKAGGQYVTIAGDCHIVDAIGVDFEKAWTIAIDNGLIPVYFKNRIRYLDNHGNA